jgi:hypothetical protein
MTNCIVSGLVQRRAELAGELDALEARIAAIAADIGQLDAVIRQFDPDFDLAAIRPKRPRAVGAADRGGIVRVALRILREADRPMTAPEIAQQVVKAQGEIGSDGLRGTLEAVRE